MTASHAVSRDRSGSRAEGRTGLALIVTGVWSVLSVAVALTWLIGMTFSFPLLDGSGRPRIGPAAITVVCWLIIGLSVAAAGAVFSGYGLRSRITPRPLALVGLVFGLIAAGSQAALVPLVLVDLVATGQRPSPVGLLWQLAAVVAVVGFGRLIVLEGRRVRGRCERCGGRHRALPGGSAADAAGSSLERPVPTMAPAAVCVGSAIALVAVFPWAVVKLGWGLGATLLGVTAAEWQQAADRTIMSAPARALSELGIDITVVAAAVGMILAVVLLARLPRWLPTPLLVVPSALAAVPLVAYGFPLLIGGLLGLGGIVRVAPDPALPGLDLPLIMIFGGLAFAGVGTALAVGAVSLFRRSRPVCRPGSFAAVPRVAVIGAGFAGLAAVKQLSRAGLEVTLIDQRPYATFQPLLYQVATGGLNAGDITYPIRNFLARRPGVRFVCDRVIEIDHDRSVINTAGGQQLGYDYVIIANGATTNHFGIPGAAEHAVGIYTRSDALQVRDRLFGLLEDATRSGSTEPTTVVIVGGGATGIEMAGNLAELRDHGLPNSYPELDADRVKIILVEAGGQLLAPFAPSLQRYGLAQLRRRGVDVRLQAPIVEIGPDSVRFADETVLPASLVIWTAGVRGSDEAGEWRLPRNRAGRILVDRSLQVPGKPEVFAVGDTAVIGANPLPQLAQPALQSGRHAARQIIRLERDQPTRPFRYFDKGIMATIGEGSAVVELPIGPRITGLLAWFTWLGIHIVYLLGGRNRLVTSANLAVRYLRPGSFGVIVGDPVRPAAADRPAATAPPRLPAGR
ncbi:NAD(P)/FAD-dependent oxidoreductase [Microlunatus speluncae]|uniref:NAD(P)/FAD-dependent oxidoreductase n=1 Tax=Microlunatus speluncae TaxID=2594267 RepID=UPI001FEB8A5C|nr:NAD(P)/FAD-dependent oxidoreductase [Microlunatus speluncae]